MGKSFRASDIALPEYLADQLIGELVSSSTCRPDLPRSPSEFARIATGGVWLEPPHIQRLDQELVDLVEDRSDVLIVSMPPRHGKSELISKFTPPWYLGRFPSHRVVLSSYEATFAETFGRKGRDLLEQHGETVFGVRVRPDVSSVSHWETTAGGGMMSVGVGGPLTGKGANLLIVDDAIKNAEQAASPTYRRKTWDWFASTALTRLEPNGKIVIVMTRWHQDDLVGQYLRSLAETPGKRLRLLVLPAVAKEDDPIGRRPGEALWPDRFDASALVKIRRQVGEYWWRALYQQDPRNPEGSEWPEEYFSERFTDWPDSGEVVLRMMALDPSKGKSDRAGDYQAITLGYATREKLFVSARLERISIANLADQFVRIAADHQIHAAIVETNQFADLLADQIQQAAEARGISFKLVRVVNTENKIIRIRAGLTGLLADKKIIFRRGVAGVEKLLDQLRDFPMGQHDDGPDSLEMLVRLWRRETSAKSSGRREVRLLVPGAI